MVASTYNLELSGIRALLFGKKKPSILTRILCWSSLTVFAIFFGWYLLNLIALKMIDTMPNAAKLKLVFEDIAYRYQISDIYQSCTNMALAGLFGSIALFIGVMLVWRELKMGYYFLFAGLFLIAFSPMLFIGVNYLANEQAGWEYLLPILVISFGIVERLILRRAN